MESESGCGLGDIAIVIIENTLDVLPFEAVERGGSELGICLGFGRIACERCENLICVGGFGQVVPSALADSFHGRCDASVAGEDQNANVRPVASELTQAGESIRSGQF